MPRERNSSWARCAHLGTHLRQDAPGGLDEHPPHVTRLDARVIAARVACHVLKLGERLDAGKSRADEHKGQRPAAHIWILGRGGDIQLRKYVIAQVNRLADGLETDSVIS